MPLTTITTPTPTPANRMLVMLHGWGANARDVAELHRYLNLPEVPMQFPDAPFDHPQVPGGKMWYGFPAGYDFALEGGLMDQADLQESRQQLRQWLLGLEAETGVPLSRTVLAGFSQGGAMTLDVGLGLPLAGLVVTSGYLHGALPVGESAPPILMVHGQIDPVVPVVQARAARDWLNDHGLMLTYHELMMGHEIQPAALALIRQFCEDLWATTSAVP